MTTMPRKLGLPEKADSMPFVVPIPSPSINEGVFEDKTNDQSLADVKEAIAGLRRAVESVQRGAAAIHENEMKTPAARHAEATEFAFKVTRPSLMACDTAAQRLASEIASLRTKVTTPPLVRDVLASEIRARLASMAPAERMKAVMSAIKSGDNQIASACLGGPAMLSGMSETEHAHVRLNWSVARHPGDVARIKALEKAPGTWSAPASWRSHTACPSPTARLSTGPRRRRAGPPRRQRTRTGRCSTEGPTMNVTPNETFTDWIAARIAEQASRQAECAALYAAGAPAFRPPWPVRTA